MNIFDAVYYGLTPYFAIKFLNKYGAKTAIEYTRGRFRVDFEPLNSVKKNILLHGASIGETLSLLPLKEALEENFPEIKVIISTATHTAYNLLRSKNGIKNDILYMPFDFSDKIKKFLQHVKPSILIITEQEIWPNLIFTAFNLRTPIFFVNFRIKPQKAFIYHFSVYKDILQRKIEKFFCANELTIQNLNELNVPDFKIMKIENLKVVPYIGKQPLSTEKFNIVTLLSIHKKEEKDLESICKELCFKYKLKIVVIPRHINFSNYFLKFFSKNFKSVISDDFDLRIFDNYDLVVINKFGVVNKILPFSKYTLLGGTFVNLGGHNILEPLFFSNKVLVGPHYYNIISEVEKGEKLNIVFKASRVKDLSDFIKYDVADITHRCRSYFVDIENPVWKVINTLRPYIVL
ncbi:MAG: 3-deoxy-D-manno-octulosonic acid transferase [Planctomycetota bacterium]